LIFGLYYIFILFSVLGVAGYKDGSFGTSLLSYPYALALDAYHGVILLGDYAASNLNYNPTTRKYTQTFKYNVRKLSLATSQVTTLAGGSSKFCRIFVFIFM